jgi:glucose/arabinose dehydrogenase
MSPYFKRTTLTLLLPLTVLAQLGDKKDEQGQEQIDPVPAEIIPPAPFLSMAEALNSFQIADGFTIEPVAWEPLVENPVAISFDPNGRMWVAEMRSYMPDIDGNGEDTPNGRIRILEDTDGDGQMDKSTDFLDDLVLPRLISLAYGGVIFNDGDALYFIERSGLRPKGKRQLIDADYAKGGNPEHKANGMLYGHDNWFYNAKSSNRYRRVDGKWIKEKTANRLVSRRIIPDACFTTRTAPFWSETLLRPDL